MANLDLLLLESNTTVSNIGIIVIPHLLQHAKSKCKVCERPPMLYNQ